MISTYTLWTPQFTNIIEREDGIEDGIFDNLEKVYPVFILYTKRIRNWLKICKKQYMKGTII